MSEQTKQPTQKSKKKRRPRWQRILIHYLPLIKACLIALLCLTLIIMMIVALVKGISKGKDKPADDSLAATAPTEPAAPTQEELAAQAAAAAISEADVMAKGYDYLGAIAHLKTVPGWESSSAIAGKIAEYETADASLVTYEAMHTITHIYFHPLIVDTERAFDEDSTARSYNMYYTTVSEFEAILESLYSKGYVLVSPYDVAVATPDETLGYDTFAYGEIRLPEGKTPFMMSQDQVNYYGYMIGGEDGSNEKPVFASANGDGFASRLVLQDGELKCEYMDASGTVQVGDYDLIPILESFIQKHPDFSYHGARAIIAVSGYEGVFGYRTKPSYEAELGNDAYEAEVKAAKEVATYLRDHGWDLASASYGMPSYGSVDSMKVDSDSTKFEETVETIIGETDILIFPNGSDIAGLENYDGNNYKFVVLYEDGYRYFFNKDNTVAWHQVGSNYFRGNRRSLDGYRLFHFPETIEDLVKADSILDTARPLPVPGP